MPSYISHAIMGEHLYNISKENQEIFRIPISKYNLIGYSLGTDLSLLSTSLKHDAHSHHTRRFFINMIKYIKDNNLTKDKEVMALLYGHIAHYFLDLNTHPLIYYLESGCKKVGLISNHNLIEGYLSAYLSKTILKKDITEIKSNYFSKINLSNKKISNLLNNVYGKTYNDYNVIKSYRKVIKLFELLEKTIKEGKIPKKLLIRITSFNNFLKKNKLNLNELTNENHDIYLNTLTGEEHNESFLELYNKAIQMTIEAIIEVNKYLYTNTPISKLNNTFQNLSYETGVKCSLGKKLIYVRKYKYNKT